MNTELTIGAINPGYGGLPIGVAAALGGATLAWHAHPGQSPTSPGYVTMRYHHPYAGAHIVIDAPPPMVDVLTVNGYDDWTITGTSLIGAGYKPQIVVVEAQLPDDEAVHICDYLDSRGYCTSWKCLCSNEVGTPYRSIRSYVIGVRNDCPVPGVNAAYLDADPWTGSLWTTPSAYDTYFDSEAYRFAQADLEGKADSRALEHWENVTGEPYPYPLYTQPATGSRMSICFVEWMMGLPIGYVSTPFLQLTTDQRMSLLYSGTVPLQAAHAAALILAQMDDK